MIHFENVSKSYEDKMIVDKQTFTIDSHDIFVLVGSSGSGKTTILKMINRLIEQSLGEIYIDGKNSRTLPLRELRLNMGYVLQQIALFPNLTVFENISLIPEMKGWSKKEQLDRASYLLDRVGLKAQDYLHRFPKELSGGEQQRIGILRAIITNPDILLMDEPFSALDPISRKQLQDLMLDLHKEFGMTIVFVTHDIEEALKMADKIAVLNKGKIVQLASPKEIIENPNDDFVRELFGGVHG